MKYDWMVEKAIERAARKFEKTTGGNVDSKLNSLLFLIRSEMRALWR